MKSAVKVSVIIPVFNAEKYLEQCLDSIKKQTLKNIEIICINNGSNDHSSNILNKYAAKDHRFTVLSTPRSNAGAARNAGLSIAKGEYLSFVDSDDFCEPEMLRTTYEAASQNGSDIVVFGFRIFDNITKQTSKEIHGINPKVPNSTFPPNKYQSDIFSLFQNCPWNKLFKRSFIIQNHISFQEIPRANDLYFTNISLALARKITAIRTPLINYRINNKNSLQGSNELSPTAFWDACKYLKNELIIRNLFKKYEHSFLNEVLSNAYYNINSLPKNSIAFKYLFNTIKYGADIEFDISSHPTNYYRKEEYQAYLNIANGHLEEKTTTQAVNQAIIDTTNRLTSSKSYKIGTAITAVPHHLKSLLIKNGKGNRKK